MIKNLRTKIEAKIEALPGSREKKQAIVNLSCYALGAGIGLIATIVTIKSAKNWDVED